MTRLRSIAFDKDYIKALAGILLDESCNSQFDMSDKTVVFAGKRPALFLKRELSRRIGQAFIPPHCISLDELVNEVNSNHLEIVKELDAVYRIYLIAKEYAPAILKGANSFASFMPWAKEIRNFIDQLDLEMVTNEALETVQAAATIGYDVPDKINDLLKNIVVIRKQFHQSLTKQSLISRALNYQEAAEKARDYTKETKQEYYFCNFYYLSASEEKLLNSIASVAEAQYIFHGDPEQWAGIKEFEKKFSTAIEYIATEKDNSIKYHACFDRHAQVVRAREIIKNNDQKDETLLLMPDEESLVPMLSELSSHVDNFNVSMGYPLWRSSLFSLIMLLFELALSKKGNKLYSKDYLKLMSHPLIKNLDYVSGADNSCALTRITVHKLEEFLLGKELSSVAGAAFIELNEIESLDDLFNKASELSHIKDASVLKGIISSIHNEIILPWYELNSFSDFTSILSKLLNILLEKANIDRYPINRKMLENLFELCEQMSDLDFAEDKFDIEQIYLIVKEVLKSQKVSFIGSPLKGMQILGLFESRSLNFKNLIIMDLNEGILPRIELNQPLIPVEVMAALGLSRVVLEEEIQRYNFKRLIGSADNVDLIFVDSDKKTRSRFVEMLLWEEEKKKEKLNVSSFSQTAFSINVAARHELVAKTPAMIEYMKNMTHSASSLKTYLDCPMCFYYRYILNLYEKEEIYDEPDARHIGTFIHELLEEAYAPFLGKSIVIDDDYVAKFFELFDHRFALYMQKNMKSEGFLLKRIMEYRLRNFLDHEHSRSNVSLLSLEESIYDKVEFSFGSLNFVSKMDRVENVDGSVLILDYKTGNSEIKSKKRNKHQIDASDRSSVKKSVGSFQLPLYIMMAEEKYKGQLLNAGLYDLKASKINYLFDNFNEQNEDILEDYKLAMELVLKEMLDPGIPFYVDTSFEHNCI